MFRIIISPSSLRASSSSAAASIRSKSTVASEGRFFPKTCSDSLMRKASSTSREQTLPAAYNKIAFLGAGNMAQAILNPLVATGIQPANQIAILDPNPDTMSQVKHATPGVQTASGLHHLLEDADLVVCAVKPQNVSAQFLQDIHDAPHKPRHGTFLSVLAGVPLATFEPTGYDKIVRSMPNTPAMIGRGMTVWCATNSLTSHERLRIDTVLSCLGESVRFFLMLLDDSCWSMTFWCGMPVSHTLSTATPRPLYDRCTLMTKDKLTCPLLFLDPVLRISLTSWKT